jgi:hypothetical protein
MFACKGMPKTVNRVAFVLEPCFPQILCKDIPGRSVAQVTPQAVKEIQPLTDRTASRSSLMITEEEAYAENIYFRSKQTMGS